MRRLRWVSIRPEVVDLAQRVPSVRLVERLAARDSLLEGGELGVRGVALRALELADARAVSPVATFARTSRTHRAAPPRRAARARRRRARARPRARRRRRGRRAGPRGGAGSPRARSRARRGRQGRRAAHPRRAPRRRARCSSAATRVETSTTRSSVSRNCASCSVTRSSTRSRRVTWGDSVIGGSVSFGEAAPREGSSACPPCPRRYLEGRPAREPIANARAKGTFPSPTRYARGGRDMEIAPRQQPVRPAGELRRREERTPPESFFRR